MQHILCEERVFVVLRATWKTNGLATASSLEFPQLEQGSPQQLFELRADECRHQSEHSAYEFREERAMGHFGLSNHPNARAKPGSYAEQWLEHERKSPHPSLTTGPNLLMRDVLAAA